MKKVLAIDIGGTNIKSGLVDYDGNISHQIHRPSHASEGRNALLNVLKEVIEIQCENENVVCIGCGSPGTVNYKTGKVTYMQAHIPQWTGTPLGNLLTKFSKNIPAVIDNDVNLIALGENWKGAGKGYNCQVSIALGTGLGGGIVSEGKLFRGAKDRAPEFGHMIVQPNGEPCTCGKFGCAEVYTAPGAMTRRAIHYLNMGIPSSLADYEKVDATEIVKQALKGDLLCRKIFDDATKYLAILIWNLSEALDPDVFVLGGGLIKAGNSFLKPLNYELEKFYCAPELKPRYNIKKSELEDDAGILGAAKLAWDAAN